MQSTITTHRDPKMGMARPSGRILLTEGQLSRDAIPRWALAGLLAILVMPSQGVGSDDDLFRTQVAPILERRCVSCHGVDHSKGGLSLLTSERLLHGGDSGPAIEP